MTQSPILSCWCTTCRPPDPADPSSMRLALCPTCGNKRCPLADGNYTLPEPPVPAIQPATPKPRTPSNGCHNRAPFKPVVAMPDGHSFPFRMAMDCQYTLSALGQQDPRCAGCRWRANLP